MTPRFYLAALVLRVPRLPFAALPGGGPQRDFFFFFFPGPQFFFFFFSNGAAPKACFKMNGCYLGHSGSMVRGRIDLLIAETCQAAADKPG